LLHYHTHKKKYEKMSLASCIRISPGFKFLKQIQFLLKASCWKTIKKVNEEAKADTIKTNALNVILWNKEVWLWKERLNSDDHHFHQYQQNKQSPFILTELTEHKKKQHINVYIYDLFLFSDWDLFKF